MIKENGHVESKLSALLYRFRGYILGLIAIALFAFPPSLFPESLCINDCVAGMLIAVPLYVASAFLRVQTRRFIGEHTRGHVHAADTLVTCGPYSRVRHPLYISNTGFALGIAFFHLGVSLWVFPFMLIVIAFEVALSKIEDPIRPYNSMKGEERVVAWEVTASKEVDGTSCAEVKVNTVSWHAVIGICAAIDDCFAYGCKFVYTDLGIHKVQSINIFLPCQCVA